MINNITMKYFVLVILLIFTSCKKEKTFIRAQHVPSKIDSLTTELQIKDYLIALDSNYKSFHLKNIPQLGLGDNPIEDKIKKAAAKKGITGSFFKEDFDNNGYTDLLVIGGTTVTSTAFKGKRYNMDWYVILNYGSTAKIVPMRLNRRTMAVPEIISVNEGVSIRVLTYEITDFHLPFTYDSISKNLVYKYNSFTEYNKSPIDNTIEKIEFSAGPCFGTCPIYKLTINNNKSSTFFAEQYNFSEDIIHDSIPANEGFFKGKINDKEYNQLVNLLNYIDFKNLKNNYAVGWTDDRSATLIITYNNGKTKEIYDYGMSGTYGLKAIYSILGDMRFKQKWEKISE